MKNHEGHKMHGIWMALCCLIPIMAVVILSFMKFQGSSVKTILGVLMILIYPLGHPLMMAFMPKDKKGNENGSQENKSCQKKPINSESS